MDPTPVSQNVLIAFASIVVAVMAILVGLFAGSGGTPGERRNLKYIVGTIVIVTFVFSTYLLVVADKSSSQFRAQGPTDDAVPSGSSQDTSDPPLMALGPSVTLTDTVNPTSTHTPTSVPPTPTDTPVPPPPTATPTPTPLPLTDTPTPVPPPATSASPAPLLEHFEVNTGSGLFAAGAFSDGMAPYSEDWLWDNKHRTVQRIQLDTNPDGCDIARFSANVVWMAVGTGTSVSINDRVVGTYTAADTPHGYVYQWPIQIGDKVCALDFTSIGYLIVFGPDVYYHYDSYCYRGYC